MTKPKNDTIKGETTRTGEAARGTLPRFKSLREVGFAVSPLVLILAAIVAVVHAHLNGAFESSSIAGMSGALFGSFAIYFAVALFVSLCAWRVRRRSKRAANTAFVATLVLLFSVFQFGRARIQAVAAADAPLAESEPSYLGLERGPTNRAPDIFDDLALRQAHESFIAVVANSTEIDSTLGYVALDCFQNGVPWYVIDRYFELAIGEGLRFTARARRAYEDWRDAAIEAGYDPRWSALDREFDSAHRQLVIEIAKFMNERGRYPSLEECKDFPANPYTGFTGVARFGQSTVVHGWSYDERTGRLRMVLPHGVRCRSLLDKQIERPGL